MRKALGRGLDALIPGAGKASQAPEPVQEATPGDLMVALDRIRPNPRQPRIEFGEGPLAELAASIRVQGVIQPLLVRRLADGDFELVAGERRLRAAERAGLTHVPVYVRDLSDGESLELALVENLQRDDLSPLEEAAAYQRLINEFGLTQEKVAERVGKSRPAVANSLRLLRLPEAIKNDIARGRLTAGHARVLLSIDNPDAQLRAAKQIQARQMSVRDAEQLASTRKSAQPVTPRDPHRAALERDLSAALGTRVRIAPKGPGGRIEIEYYSPEELQGLVDRIGGRGSGF
ncbi:MAG: ParB/RepB/Spo0J family partition protein [Deltaproteobacteria bacterium]|nr:ParB/RepB/Spo0J family partition protein [Deltaproteobacteria bacterium]